MCCARHATILGAAAGAAAKVSVDSSVSRLDLGSRDVAVAVVTAAAAAVLLRRAHNHLARGGVNDAAGFSSSLWLLGGGGAEEDVAEVAGRNSEAIGLRFRAGEGMEPVVVTLVPSDSFDAFLLPSICARGG